MAHVVECMSTAQNEYLAFPDATCRLSNRFDRVIFGNDGSLQHVDRMDMVRNTQEDSTCSIDMHAAQRVSHNLGTSVQKWFLAPPLLALDLSLRTRDDVHL